MYIPDIPRAARLCLSICSVKGRKGAKEVSSERLKYYTETIMVQVSVLVDVVTLLFVYRNSKFGYLAKELQVLRRKMLRLVDAFLMNVLPVT